MLNRVTGCIGIRGLPVLFERVHCGRGLKLLRTAVSRGSFLDFSSQQLVLQVTAARNRRRSMWITQHLIDQRGGYRILKAAVFKTRHLVNCRRPAESAGRARQLVTAQPLERWIADAAARHPGREAYFADELRSSLASGRGTATKGEPSSGRESL
jgi:hypothetical protein